MVNFRLETVLLLKLNARQESHYPIPNGTKERDRPPLLALTLLPFWGVRGARLCPAVSGRVWPCLDNFFFFLERKELREFQQIGQLEVRNFFHVVEL